MKNVFKRKGVQKVTAILLSAMIMLSALAMLPADLFKASAAMVDGERLEFDFNNNWKFYLGDPTNAEARGFDDSEWGTVELPHDFSISQDYFTGYVEAESGNLPGGTGWYRKMFSLPTDYKDKNLILNFDGSYKDTWVYVNGQLVGENHYGYNSFSFDITDYVTCNGESANFIAVKVENEIPSSRWYSGSGIYRDVTLTVVDPVHVDLYGTYVTTPNLESSSGTDGTVNAIVTLVNTEIQEQVTVKAEVLDASGNVVGTADSKEVSVPVNQQTTVTLNPVVQNPSLWYSWDTGTPTLYTLRVTVLENGTAIDTYDTEFGFRWIKWELDNGFSINGVPVKVQGVCQHHDQGALGAVQTYDALYRQVKILQDMGCNAIRSSHNTTSRVLMDVCNELGMMVMAEFFDGWDAQKNGNSNDFSKHFNVEISGTNNIINAQTDQKWYQFVLQQSVLRDRNDPSVIIWDVANELPNASGYSASNYATYAEDMRRMLDELDPTRPVTEGNNRQGITDSTLAGVDEFMSVIGGNYYPASWSNNYDSLATTTDGITGAVGKPFVMTESTSALSTRGHYSNSGSGTNATNGWDINAYDTTYVSWGTSAAGTLWYNHKLDWFSGFFIWTGFDYLGEPTTTGSSETNLQSGSYGEGYPNSSYFGVIDTAGYAKDSYYLYRSMWNSNSTTLHLIPGTWDADALYVDGDGMVDVAVYSNADKVSLFRNGTEIGYAIATTNTSDNNSSTGLHTYKTWTETATDSTYCNTNEFYTGTGKDLYPQFHVKHSESDTITVKAYKLENGNYVEITDTVGTTKAAKITATHVVPTISTYAPTNYTADGDSYIYVEYEAQDADGNFDNDYNGTLEIEIGGHGATIVGVDNGDPVDTQRLQQKTAVTSPTTATVKMFNGRALVILRTNEETGDVAVVTSADDLTVVDNGVTFTVTAESGDELTDEFEEVTDQSNVVFVPSVYDRFIMIQSGLSKYELPEEPAVTYNYTKYTPATSGSPVESGDYVIYNQGYIMTDEYMSSPTAGINRTAASPIDGVISTSDWNEYTFTLVDGETDQYYIQNRKGEYISLGSSDGSLTLSDEPVALTISATSNGEVLIYNSSNQFIDHYSAESTPRFNSWNSTVSGANANKKLVLYSKDSIYDSDSAPSTTDYLKYTPATSGTPVESGEYVVYNQGYIMIDEYLTSPAGINREAATPENDVITTLEKNDYTFTLVDGSTDQYYISNSDGKYISLSSGNGSLTLSDDPVALTISATSDGEVLIYNSSNQFIDHYINESVPRFNSWSTSVSGAGTNNKLVLYRMESEVEEKTYSKYTATDSTTPVEDGVYVIHNDSTGTNNVKMVLFTNTTVSGGIHAIDYETPADGVITTIPDYEYTFTQVSDNTYTVVDSQGRYMTIGTSNGSLSLSETYATVTVSYTNDGRILIYNDSQFLDHYRGENKISTWSTTISDAANNNRMQLYALDENAGGGESGGDDSGTTGDKITVPENKLELYNALLEATEHTPGTYSTASYNDLIVAMEDGYALLEDENATDEQIAAAVQTINDAIAGLEVFHKTFSGTIYKYGYNPNSSTPYANGGDVFNELTYASMEQNIRLDDNLVEQIKVAIDYYGTNGTAWGDDTYKDAALDLAIEKYARIYSLAFVGSPVTGSSTTPSYENTAWNVWIKNNTQASDESADEGASVQGLFSAQRQDGQPSDHATYATLPYANICSESTYPSYDTQDGITISFETSETQTENTTVTLPALQDISVHINDLFKKENVLAADSTEEYAKFYWDLSVPFVATTNEYGINTYTYDSDSTEYLYQITYDDDTQTAEAQLTYNDNWSVERSNKGTGKGFFPFNYQNNTSTVTGENAIYHFALNFAMDFQIPTSGTYADGQDVVFEFHGDDDVLVYIDDVLVLDNGGVHGARSATINFTDASVSYQYAMDVAEGTVINTAEDSTVFAYGAENDGISADNLAALEKLNEVRTNGGYHTLSFYYVERGSTDSNFYAKMNIQEISDNVKLDNQTYAVDFGIPMDFDIKENDYVSTALTNGNTVDVQYMGITDANKPVTEAIVFAEPTDVAQTYVGTMSVLNVNGLNYGDCTINARGAGTYTPTTMNFTGSDYFYNVAKVGNDPTYSEGISYYIYERVRFIPATTIYYEDDFTGVTYTDGTTTDGSGHGVWSTIGDATLFEDAVQAADRVNSGTANPFGYDPAYDNCVTYSGHTAKMVTVSAANNPRNGGTSPTVEFEFTGTGFDVLSLTDTTSGVFTVEILDANGDRVGKRKIVNTYYGYGYGQLYADENGETTLTVTDTPVYKGEQGVTIVPMYYTVDGTAVSETVTYLDSSGNGYTETPTYYDADGNITTTETEDPAYAYAYAFGWVDSDDANAVGIYQVPVIKILDLDYGTYTVIITPTYSSMHDVKGNGSYNLYVDAIRIYDPAGVDDVPGTDIVDGYKYNKEAYPAYLQIKEMLIGADSLGVNDTQGVIFIDGIAALNNDLDTYKKAGPNNELYLAMGQAVAFEVWATGIPESVQIGASSAQGTATLGVTYGESSAEKALNTSTDMYYDLNTLLPVGGKLTWTRTEVDGVAYYKTNTIVIQNTSDVDSIMSISNVKWTFTGVGNNGHFQVNDVPVEVALMSTEETVTRAYTMLAPTSEVIEPDTTPDVEPDTEPDVDDDNNELNFFQRIINFIKRISNFFTKIFSKFFS